MARDRWPNWTDEQIVEGYLWAEPGKDGWESQKNTTERETQGDAGYYSAPEPESVPGCMVLLFGLGLGLVAFEGLVRWLA